MLAFAGRWSRYTLIAICFAALGGAAGCGSDAPFNPDNVDLSGIWLFDVHQTAEHQGVIYDCHFEDLPIRIQVTNGGPEDEDYNGFVEGTVSVHCTADGEPVEDGVYVSPLFFRIYVQDAALEFRTQSNVTVSMTGELLSSSRMAGELHPEGWGGYTGTWEARR